METIRPDALRDIIALCPSHMVESASTAQDNYCEVGGVEISDRGIRVDYDDWKIIFHGYGFVELSKGDHAPATYGANDPAYRGRENVLSLMMAHYERKNRLHDAAAKYKAERDEIWDAAQKLYDAGAISSETLSEIRGNFGPHWVLKQAKRELYGEE